MSEKFNSIDEFIFYNKNSLNLSKNVQLYEDNNIVEGKELYLIHYSDCVSNRPPSKFDEHIFQKYPEANIYLRRRSGFRNVPGTINLTTCLISEMSNYKKLDNKEPLCQKIIVAFFMQKYPGISKWKNDSISYRKGWFTECLIELGRLPNLDQGIAFCCSSKNYDFLDEEWKNYLFLILDFASSNPQYKISIYYTKASSPFIFSSIDSSKKTPTSDSDNNHKSSNPSDKNKKNNLPTKNLNTTNSNTHNSNNNNNNSNNNNDNNNMNSSTSKIISNLLQKQNYFHSRKRKRITVKEFL